MSGPGRAITGGCLCGAVRYRVAGPLRPTVNACHCSQCRRQHGALGMFSSAAEKDVLIEGRDRIRWYQSSPDARRAFCGICGSKLFWQEIGSDALDIVAGTLDQPSGLRLVRHIYVASKGDYYEIGDDLPKFPASAPE
jgi:hypothetical protein